MNTIKIQGSLGDVKKLLGLKDFSEYTIRNKFEVSDSVVQILNIEVNRGNMEEYQTFDSAVGRIILTDQYDCSLEVVVE